jgi:predicted amidohydrolase YtcJ
MNKSQPHAEAVAIKSDKIIKVGSTDEISYFIQKTTKVVYLDGRTVLPGLIDTHIHVGDFGRFLMWMDLTGMASIAEMQVGLAQRLEKVPKGKWIVGRGWNENRFSEKRLPTKYDLDKVSHDNPVIFYHQSGQVALVNSKALELACVTGKTNAPSGGVVDQEEKTFEPTGILRERATDLVWRIIPEPNFDELVEAASLACQKILQNGITSIHWLAESALDISILKRLLADHMMYPRVYMVIPFALLADQSLFENLNGDMARIGGIEICADGFLASQTAALFEPYKNDKLNSGKLLLPQSTMNRYAKSVVKKGYQLVVHAMGDKAVELALNAIERLTEKNRCRIDAASLLNEELISRIRREEVVVSVQPLVAASEFSVYDAEDHLGKERTRWLYPLRSLFAAGVCVCGGSDCPMELLNPLLGIQSVITRQFVPEEQVSINQALQMYTINSAKASCEEKKKGTIEEGKFADLTVLSSDLCKILPCSIQDIVVEMTIVGGEVAYSISESDVMSKKTD